MRKFFILLGAIFALTSNVYAADIWEMADSDQYGQKAGGMFARGLVNAASCFVDFAVQTVEGTQAGPPVVGTLGGMGTGAACTVIRAASGVLDVATFWIPDFHGIPVSRSYSNCLESGSTSSKVSPQRVQAKSTPNVAAQQSTTHIVPKSSPPKTSVKAPVSSAKTIIKDASASANHDAMKYVKK